MKRVLYARRFRTPEDLERAFVQLDRAYKQARAELAREQKQLRGALKLIDALQVKQARMERDMKNEREMHHILDSLGYYKLSADERKEPLEQLLRRKLAREREN